MAESHCRTKEGGTQNQIRRITKFGNAAIFETPCNGGCILKHCAKGTKICSGYRVSKSRKSVWITTPPAHEIENDSSLHKRMDKLEDTIRSLRVTSQANSPSPVDPSVKCVTGKQPQRQFLSSRPKGEAQGSNQPPGQNKKNSKIPSVQPFNASVDVQQGQTRQTATSPYLRDRVFQGNRPSSGGY